MRLAAWSGPETASVSGSTLTTRYWFRKPSRLPPACWLMKATETVPSGPTTALENWLSSHLPAGPLTCSWHRLREDPLTSSGADHVSPLLSEDAIRMGG